VANLHGLRGNRQIFFVMQRLWG